MRSSAVLLVLAAAGCQSVAGPATTPLVSCADAQFAGATARLASNVDVPPEPVGGLDAVQRRVRIPNEGGRFARATSEADRWAVVRAVVDTAGVVRCSDAVDAASPAKGDAARRAVHASPFVPGQHAGQPSAVVVDLRLDVRGEGVRRVVRGDQIRQ
ncbi:hypothetical protein [Rubrivirga sp.]|uniref:hypothetical protein n=1 Tax=Rubrivirga sp. TaxID=1885344 RepID=UPI003B52C1E5